MSTTLAKYGKVQLVLALVAVFLLPFGHNNINALSNTSVVTNTTTVTSPILENSLFSSITKAVTSVVKAVVAVVAPAVNVVAKVEIGRAHV